MQRQRSVRKRGVYKEERFDDAQTVNVDCDTFHGPPISMLPRHPRLIISPRQNRVAPYVLFIF